VNAEQFGTWAQGYYGEYRLGQKRDVWEYLKAQRPEYLDALKAAVLKGFSSQYGRPPDVAVFEQCRPQAEAILAASTPAPPAIEDNRPQATPADVADFVKAYEKKYGRRCPLPVDDYRKSSKPTARLPEKSTIR